MALQIVFVENKKLKSTLLEDIDESLTPDIYGGRLPLVPVLWLLKLIDELADGTEINGYNNYLHRNV